MLSENMGLGLICHIASSRILRLSLLQTSTKIVALFLIVKWERFVVGVVGAVLGIA